MRASWAPSDAHAAEAASQVSGDEEQQPMFAGGAPRARAGSAPEVDRIKSNPGLRFARQPWLLAAGGAVALVLVALAVISATKAGASSESDPAIRRTQVVVGHPPEHMRTQAPTAAPGFKHPVNIGNVLDSPLLVPPADTARGQGAGAVEASGGGQRPARAAVGHPPEHTQTLPPGAGAAAP